jgi:hypothetical protein
MIREITEMKRFAGFAWIIFLLAALCVPSAVFGQDRNSKTKSQELSDDGLPVLVKHLPDWESRRLETSFVSDQSGLKKALGNRPILDLIDFSGGTEAATASYPAGKLLIVEYTNPQASIDADQHIAQYLAQNPDDHTSYRRTGNYNIFVFDPSDPAAASALIDQVKYEKNIQWLGEDPFLFKRLERNFVNTSADIFVSTVEWIALGIGSTLLAGLIIGLVYFQFRERQRLTMNEFSDAGGMIRLNLDGLTHDLTADRLLNE